MQYLSAIYIFCTLKIDLNKEITDVIMFDGASNLQLGSDLLKIYYQNLAVMSGVEHNVSLLFHCVSKVTIVTQIIRYQNSIYIFWDQAYFISPIAYSNQNLIDFINGIFSYSVEMIPEWRYILWECT